MFDLTEVKEASFEPMEAGYYPVTVDNAEFKTSKAGAEYLNLTLKVIGENNNGRVIFDIMNLFHPTEKVSSIAKSSLKGMMVSMGYEGEKLKIKSKEALIEAIVGQQAEAKVGVQRSDEYGDKNIIKGWKMFKSETPKVDQASIPF